MSALLGDRSFWIAAGAAVILVIAARAADRRWPVAIGDGLPVAAGALVGLSEAGRLPVTLVGSMVLLAAGAWLASTRSGVARLAATLPGAALLGVAVGANAPTWTRVVAGCATVVFVPLANTFDRDHARLTNLFFAISAVGVYATVPNTEEARVLVAATLVGGAIALTRGLVDPVGTTALVGLLAWAAAIGGYARPGAVIGGLACVGVLALAPLVRAVALPVPALLTAHVALVVVASRVAGLRERASVSTAIVAATYGIVAATCALVGVVTCHRARRASRSISDRSTGAA